MHATSKIFYVIVSTVFLIMSKIVKYYYTNEKYDTFKLEEFSIEELNKKIIPTTEINKKYKIITSCEISSDLYLDNLKNNYNIDPKKEFWRKYSDNEYIEVSNFGRVKFQKRLLGFKDIAPLSGYLKCSPDESNEFVYQMVAKTWLLKPKNSCTNCMYEVHHISNDGYDNRVENLIYLTKCEHLQINHRTKE